MHRKKTYRSLRCQLFGHKFTKISDLRKKTVRRNRVVYRCVRCEYPLIVRAEAGGKRKEVFTKRLPIPASRKVFQGSDNVG